MEIVVGHSAGQAPPFREPNMSDFVERCIRENRAAVAQYDFGSYAHVGTARAGRSPLERSLFDVTSQIEGRWNAPPDVDVWLARQDPPVGMLLGLERTFRMIDDWLEDLKRPDVTTFRLAQFAEQYVPTADAHGTSVAWIAGSHPGQLHLPMLQTISGGRGAAGASPGGVGAGGGAIARAEKARLSVAARREFQKARLRREIDEGHKGIADALEFNGALKKSYLQTRDPTVPPRKKLESITKVIGESHRLPPRERRTLRAQQRFHYMVARIEENMRRHGEL